MIDDIFGWRLKENPPDAKFEITRLDLGRITGDLNFLATAARGAEGIATALVLVMAAKECEGCENDGKPIRDERYYGALVSGLAVIAEASTDRTYRMDERIDEIIKQHLNKDRKDEVTRR